MAEAAFYNAAPLAAFPLAALAFYIVWRVRRWWRIIPALVGLIALVVGGYFFWYTHRPLPTPTERTLFTGVTYIRDVRAGDRPLVIHVVRIDLSAPGLGFLSTPHTPTEGHDQRARTVSAFLDEFDLQLAINGDFFDPWRDYGPLDYYPHEGDPVNIRGLTIADGDRYTEGYTSSPVPTFFVSQDNRVGFETAAFDPYNALSGNFMLLREGVVQQQDGLDSYLRALHPRTALGLDQAEQTLIVVIVDGRQPGYSEGVSIPELAEIMLEYGAYTALNLDGGGSSALVIEGEDGRPEVLNSPIHTRIPGRERPVANHLGIYVQRLGE
jgi:hypothetical protein